MLVTVKARVLPLICLIALTHAAAFIVYQRPDWNTSWTDQEGYQRLGAVLATTGMFTRYPDSPVFVPEVIRTPGYPAFVALVYRAFGVGSHLAVAIAQAVVFAGLCVIVYGSGRRVAGERIATAAGVAAALFSPFPYFGALVLTELWTAFIAALAMLVCVRAVQDRKLRDFALAGCLLSATTLVRPAFVLLPFFLAVAMPVLVRSERGPRAAMAWASLGVAAAVTLAPWFAYNAVYLDRFTLSPAGGIGRGLWEGAWQGRWPGRVHAQLTSFAEAATSDADLDARVRALAADTGLAPEPMRAYVREWRSVHAVWDTPTDPMDRTRARVVADQEYLRLARDHIAEDPVGHTIRRLTQGTFVLWAAEVPIRYSDINATPPWVIRGLWAVQVTLAGLAVWGIVVLAKGGRWPEAALLGLPLVYVTGVHLPLLCEARQSLPVKPVLLTLAAVGGDAIHRRLFPLKP